MAKRARGSHRPGQRPPLQKATVTPKPAATSATAATATPKPATLTEQEEARAAELEAQIVAEERAADDARRRSGRRREPSPVEAAPRASLAISAAEEYAYVGRDVRRIAVIGGSLITFLIVLSIVSHVSGAGPI